MTAVQHFALGCCLLSAMAGMVRIFWPENGFKPVINTVLLLYIVASVLPLTLHTDWQAMSDELRSWAHTPLKADDYSAYAAQLAEQAAAAALTAQLQAAGIEAEATIADGHCTVRLAPGQDTARAADILAQSCGPMPYTLQQEGGQP